MRTFQARIWKENRGFSLLELLVVLLLMSIFLPFSLVRLEILKEDEENFMLSALSTSFSLLREKAVTEYVTQYVELDVTNNTIKIGYMDVYVGFVPEREIRVQGPYVLKDVVINGEKLVHGRCVVRFYPTGLVDRVIMHFEGERGSFYSVVLDPLTATVQGYDGYREEPGERQRADLT
jgi:prepilin-type N-terminal cleavage/methylation domain-containing protein